MYSQVFSAAMSRQYSRTLHAHDVLAWSAIRSGRCARSTALPGIDFTRSSIFAELMRPLGLHYAAAAPLADPAMANYRGAVLVVRTARQGDYSDAELRELARLAQQLEKALSRRRNLRSLVEGGAPAPARSPGTLVILDARLKLLVPETGEVDAALQTALRRDAETRLARLRDGPLIFDRVALDDSTRTRHNFRVVAYPSYPALTSGAAIFYCPAPSCDEWDLLRAGDFPADPELARLIPAIRFMRQRYHQRASLIEIARSVELSAFHFHRQFTRLLGITPKHLMLDLQIDRAERELLADRNDLSTIARECGFAHQSHFTSRFRQATGLTPTRWRRMAQGKSERG